MTRIKHILSTGILIAFIANNINPAFAQTTTPSVVSVSSSAELVRPLIIQGLKVDLKKPFHFNFLMTRSPVDMREDELKAQSERLIRYFLTSLTVPEKDLWVNLSPNEPNRIVDEEFGKTEMAQVMLEEDYALKQLTSSLINPENENGRALWEKIFHAVEKETGSTDIPVDILSKVWIVPDKAKIFINNQTAIVLKCNLRVMIDDDVFDKENLSKNNAQYSPEMIRVLKETLIPVIEQEVNNGTAFAQLRQIYYSFVLAAWYKRYLKNSLLNHQYSNRNKTAGIDLADQNMAEKIYNKYLEHFRTAAQSSLHEEYDAQTGNVVVRKYMTGGIVVKADLEPTSDERELDDIFSDAAMMEVEGNFQDGDDFAASSVLQGMGFNGLMAALLMNKELNFIKPVFESKPYKAPTFYGAVSVLRLFQLGLLDEQWMKQHQMIRRVINVFKEIENEDKPQTFLSVIFSELLHNPATGAHVLRVLKNLWDMDNSSNSQSQKLIFFFLEQNLGDSPVEQGVWEFLGRQLIHRKREYQQNILSHLVNVVKQRQDIPRQFFDIAVQIVLDKKYYEGKWVSAHDTKDFTIMDFDTGNAAADFLKSAMENNVNIGRAPLEALYSRAIISNEEYSEKACAAIGVAMVKGYFKDERRIRELIERSLKVHTRTQQTLNLIRDAIKSGYDVSDYLPRIKQRFMTPEGLELAKQILLTSDERYTNSRKDVYEFLEHALNFEERNMPSLSLLKTTIKVIKEALEQSSIEIVLPDDVVQSMIQFVIYSKKTESSDMFFLFEDFLSAVARESPGAVEIMEREIGRFLEQNLKGWYEPLIAAVAKYHVKQGGLNGKIIHKALLAVFMGYQHRKAMQIQFNILGELKMDVEMKENDLQKNAFQKMGELLEDPSQKGMAARYVLRYIGREYVLEEALIEKTVRVIFDDLIGKRDVVREHKMSQMLMSLIVKQKGCVPGSFLERLIKEFDGAKQRGSYSQDDIIKIRYGIAMMVHRIFHVKDFKLTETQSPLFFNFMKECARDKFLAKDKYVLDALYMMIPMTEFIWNDWQDIFVEAALSNDKEVRIIGVKGLFASLQKGHTVDLEDMRSIFIKNTQNLDSDAEYLKALFYFYEQLTSSAEKEVFLPFGSVSPLWETIRAYDYNGKSFAGSVEFFEGLMAKHRKDYQHLKSILPEQWNAFFNHGAWVADAQNENVLIKSAYMICLKMFNGSSDKVSPADVRLIRHAVERLESIDSSEESQEMLFYLLSFLGRNGSNEFQQYLELKVSQIMKRKIVSETGKLPVSPEDYRLVDAVSQSFRSYSLIPLFFNKRVPVELRNYLMPILMSAGYLDQAYADIDDDRREEYYTVMANSYHELGVVAPKILVDDILSDQMNLDDLKLHNDRITRLIVQHDFRTLIAELDRNKDLRLAYFFLRQSPFDYSGTPGMTFESFSRRVRIAAEKLRYQNEDVVEALRDTFLNAGWSEAETDVFIENLQKGRPPLPADSSYLDKYGRFIPQRIDLLDLWNNTDTAAQSIKSFESSVETVAAIFIFYNLTQQLEMGIKKRFKKDEDQKGIFIQRLEIVQSKLVHGADIKALISDVMTLNDEIFPPAGRREGSDPMIRMKESWNAAVNQMNAVVRDGMIVPLRKKYAGQSKDFDLRRMELRHLVHNMDQLKKYWAKVKELQKLSVLQSQIIGSGDVTSEHVLKIFFADLADKTDFPSDGILRNILDDSLGHMIMAYKNYERSFEQTVGDRDLPKVLYLNYVDKTDLMQFFRFSDGAHCCLTSDLSVAGNFNGDADFVETEMSRYLTNPTTMVWQLTTEPYGGHQYGWYENWLGADYGGDKHPLIGTEYLYLAPGFQNVDIQDAVMRKMEDVLFSLPITKIIQPNFGKHASNAMDPRPDYLPSEETIIKFQILDDGKVIHEDAEIIPNRPVRNKFFVKTRPAEPSNDEAMMTVNRSEKMPGGIKFSSDFLEMESVGDESGQVISSVPDFVNTDIQLNGLVPLVVHIKPLNDVQAWVAR